MAIATSLVATVALQAGAAEVTGQAGEDANEATAATANPREPARIDYEEWIRIAETAPSPDSTFVTRDEMETARIHNLAQAFETLPGVAGVRRNQNYLEPVVRGMGWERVQTQWNGLPLYGGCPGRMDPPACVVSGISVERADVIKGLASVTLGPAGTGGRLEISSDYDRAGSAPREFRPWFRSTYDDAREGYSLAAGGEGGTGRFGVKFGAETLDHADYESPDGRTVAALHEETGGFASFGWRVGAKQRLKGSLVLRDEGRTDYPALPMDTDDTTSTLLSFGWSVDREHGPLRQVEARIGYSDVEHLMSNRHKPTRRMMEAETLGIAESGSAAVTTRWRAARNVRITAGADLASLARDANRSRRMVMSGMTFFDHLWPDVTQDDTGLFAEAAILPANGWRVRIGARVDSVRSRAGAADDRALGGMTIRQAYVRYYGTGAVTVDRDETLASANALLSRRLDGNWQIHGGAGVVQRAAGITERYFAFAPAPNGFVVGNPLLDAETKLETSVGLTFNGERIGGGLTLFHYDVGDYIYSNVLERRDVNGDGAVDAVRGFSNVDATLVGAELSALVRPSQRVSVPITAAFVRGQNDSTGDPLPEIPALEGTIAAQYAFGRRRAGSVELGGRFVSRQERIDPTFGENATAGYSIWHLRGRLPLGKATQLEIGVENLLDRRYNEHLTREVLLPVGDLLRGDEVPQPGRSLHVAVRAGL